MHIVQSCGSKSWGGLEMQTLKIALGLRDRGEEVTLFCVKDSTLQREAVKQDLKFESLFDGERGFARSISAMKSYLSNHPVELIHTHLSHDLWTIVPSVQLSGSRISIFLTKRMASDVKKKDVFHRYLYSHVDRIYAISNYIRRSVLRTCPVQEDKVVLQWNALSLESYHPEHYDRNEIRESLSLNSDVCVVGMVGRFTPGKGHSEFLRAAKILKNAFKQKIAFLVVGGSSHGEEAYYRNIREFAAKILEKEGMIFTGFQEDIPRMMKAMDILAFPSHAESFGNILLEAMAMELPIVASSSGGVPDIVLPEETGLLVPPHDPEALADAISRLVKDKDLRKRLAAKGRQRVEKRFDFKDYIEKLLSDYQEYKNIHDPSKN